MLHSIFCSAIYKENTCVPVCLQHAYISKPSRVRKYLTIKWQLVYLYDISISSVYNIFRHPVHVKLWVEILCRRELYARTYYTSYIPKCGKARCNQSGGITIPKRGHFQITSNTPHFGTQKYTSTRTEEAWVGG